MLQFLPYMVAAWLLLVGLYGIVTSRNLVHAITCLSVAQSSTYILLLSVGFRAAAPRPSSSTSPSAPGPSTRWSAPSP